MAAQQNAGRKPDFYVYTTGGQGKPNIRVGAAWKHGKGTGMNITLDALPTSGAL